MEGGRAVRWHKLPYAQFVLYEAKRPMFRPFLYGAAATFVIAGMLPTLGMSQEDKEKSKYWQRTNGKYDPTAHH